MPKEELKINFSKLSLFDRSELTIVWVHDKIADKMLNVFSVIEMCPKEQPISKEIQSDDNNKTLLRRSINKNLTLYITRLFYFSPREALEFYRGSENFRSFKIGGNLLDLHSVGKMEQEPPNEIPLLIQANLYPDDKALANLLPKRPVAQRVCSLLDSNESTYQWLGNKNAVKISTIVKDVLGIDIIKYSEYIGSFLLSMPNPYLRKMKTKLSHDETAVIIELYLRKDMDLAGGEIHITDERKNGKGFTRKVEIGHSHLIIAIPYSPEKLRIRLFSPEGILLNEESSYFMKKLELNMHIAGPTNFVHLQGENGELIEKSKISTYSSHRSIVEAENEASIHDKLAMANDYRLLDRLEETYTFIYFEGNSDESKRKATEIIRELISQTNEECTICDPYLSGKDVARYATHVRNRGAVIRLLSSASFLTRKSESGSDKSQGEILNSVLQQLKKYDSSLKMSCKVLSGNKKSPLHDRFLIIDQKVYILGSSLNEFGSRSTTLFRVPDARKIERQVDLWWKDSPILDEWLNSRREDGEEVE